MIRWAEDFAQLDAPLIERVDVPNDALSEDRVLVQRDQRPSVAGVSLSARIVFEGRLPSNARCGTSDSAVPSAHLARPSCQMPAPRLGEDIGHQKIVVVPQRIERLAETDEVARDQPGALMDQLVERVLAIGARLAPVDRARVCSRRPCRRA